MKITLISTYDTSGGAAIAAFRLYKALDKLGFSSDFLVQNKISTDSDIKSIANNWLTKKASLLRFALDRLYFLFFEKSKQVRFAFSQGNIGTDISQHASINKSNIIHLHWINFGFLSINSIKKLSKLNKPIVWTLHDMWAFTGGCHYSGDCENFKKSCGNCINFLKKPSDSDLSNQVWNSKMELFSRPNFTIVACSEWLANKARQSSLLDGKHIISIPNPIDTLVFKPVNKQIAQNYLNLSTQKKYILFAAAKINDSRKGFNCLIEALSIIKNRNNIFAEIEIIIFGNSSVQDLDILPFKVNYLGQITSQETIVKTYSAANVFVTPSLEDNLPNTIMEAMACGTPVVGFETGGIPEMIDHQENGYLAKYKSAEDLANGIEFVLNNSDYGLLSANARNKVIENYAEEVVGQKYINLYKSIS